MKTQKMSLADIKGKLSRAEMKKIMAGKVASCPTGEFSCTCNGTNYGCVSSIQACWDKC